VGGERHLDERLVLRAPWLFRHQAKLLLATLPLGSRVRERVAKLLLARAFEALAREDYEVIMLTYDPGVEIRIIGDDAYAAGFAERYHGHQGYRDVMRVWRTEWVDPRFTPDELIDLGDRWIVRMTLSGRGARSGAEVTQTCGYVQDGVGGLIVHMDFYWDWSACVELCGLGDGSASTVSTAA